MQQPVVGTHVDHPLARAGHRVGALEPRVAVEGVEERGLADHGRRGVDDVPQVLAEVVVARKRAAGVRDEVVAGIDRPHVARDREVLARLPGGGVPAAVAVLGDGFDLAGPVPGVERGQHDQVAQVGRGGGRRGRAVEHRALHAVHNGAEGVHELVLVLGHVRDALARDLLVHGVDPVGRRGLAAGVGGFREGIELLGLVLGQAETDADRRDPLVQQQVRALDHVLLGGVHVADAVGDLDQELGLAGGVLKPGAGLGVGDRVPLRLLLVEVLAAGDERGGEGGARVGPQAGHGRLQLNLVLGGVRIAADLDLGVVDRAAVVVGRVVGPGPEAPRDPGVLDQLADDGLGDVDLGFDGDARPLRDAPVHARGRARAAGGQQLRSGRAGERGRIVACVRRDLDRERVGVAAVGHELHPGIGDGRTLGQRQVLETIGGAVTVPAVAHAVVLRCGRERDGADRLAVVGALVDPPLDGLNAGAVVVLEVEHGRGRAVAVEGARVPPARPRHVLHDEGDGVAAGPAVPVDDLLHHGLDVGCDRVAEVVVLGDDVDLPEHAAREVEQDQDRRARDVLGVERDVAALDRALRQDRQAHLHFLRTVGGVGVRKLDDGVVGAGDQAGGVEADGEVLLLARPKGPAGRGRKTQPPGTLYVGYRGRIVQGRGAAVHQAEVLAGGRAALE